MTRTHKPFKTPNRQYSECELQVPTPPKLSRTNSIRTCPGVGLRLRQLLNETAPHHLISASTSWCWKTSENEFYLQHLTKVQVALPACNPLSDVHCFLYPNSNQLPDPLPFCHSSKYLWKGTGSMSNLTDLQLICIQMFANRRGHGREENFLELIGRENSSPQRWEKKFNGGIWRSAERRYDKGRI